MKIKYVTLLFVITAALLILFVNTPLFSQETETAWKGEK